MEIATIDIPPLSMQVIGGASLIFCLRVVDVTLMTMRMIMVLRGRRFWSAVISFVAITIWVFAISQVLTNLNDIWNILAYSSGFTAGTLVGMLIESKLAIGYEQVQVISMTKGREIAQKIRDAGYGATELTAHGQSGPVYLIGTVVPRQDVPNIIQLVNSVDSSTFVTVDDTQKVLRGYHTIIK